MKQTEADLVAAFIALGLHLPENANDKPVKTTLSGYVYWLNKDSRGGIWINGDEARSAKPGDSAERNADDASPSPATESAESPTLTGPVEAQAPDVSAPEAQSGVVVDEPPAPADSAPVDGGASAAVEPAPVATAVVEAPVATEVAASPESPELEPVASNSPLAAVRLLLNPNKRGSGVSAEVGYLARTLNKDLQDFLTVLTELGLALPATEEDKPSFVEHADEIFWLNKNPKDGSVWINAKASKASAKKAANGAKPKAKKADKDE